MPFSLCVLVVEIVQWLIQRETPSLFTPNSFFTYPALWPSLPRWDSATLGLPAKVGQIRLALCHGWMAANVHLRAAPSALSLLWQMHLLTCCPCLAQLRACTVLHKWTFQYPCRKSMIILPYLARELFKKLRYSCSIPCANLLVIRFPMVALI